MVPYQFSVDWYDSLLAAGAVNTKFQTITNGPHNVWTETYRRADLYQWMLMVSWLPQFYPLPQPLEPLFIQDTDGDGMSSEQEYDAGTSPTDEFSVFRILPTGFNGGELEIVWSSVPGKTYTVFSGTAPGEAGQPLQPENIPADPSQINRLRFSPSGSNTCFRIETSR